MNFYRIEDEDTTYTKWAFAGGYGPIANDIDDIPFLEGTSEAFKKRHMEFWRINKSPPGIKFEPGGKDWPDIMGCGGGPPHFFVSDKIMGDLRDFGIPTLRATEMPLIKPYPKKLRESDPPRYFVLEGIPGLEVSWAAMGIPHDINNRIDLSQGYPKPWPPDEWKVSKSSWTGLELMSYKNHQLPMTLVCTDEIKDLAEARQWTNIQFKPLVTTP